MTVALPAGFGIQIDAEAQQLDPVTLLGGSPRRMLRLSPCGVAAWQELQSGPVRSRASGILARQLTDAGMAHPRPPANEDKPDVTVVIPVFERVSMLDRCLAALGDGHPVVVIDDGSTNPQEIATVVHRHGATLIRLGVNGGPSSARNRGLEQVTSDYVAFIDSDCVPPTGWIDALATHFADPLVGAVAPRMVASRATTVAGRLAGRFGSLDLGDRSARVVPRSRVAYVPSAALLMRRAALDEVGPDGVVLDPGLRFGEDVDLVWRLHSSDWRVRYDPSVEVVHSYPERWAAMLERPFRYGTSAASLSKRHPQWVVPVVLEPLPTLTVAALLARRPLGAAVAFAACVVTSGRARARVGIPSDSAVPASADAVHRTWVDLGRWLRQLAGPMLFCLFVRDVLHGRWGRVVAVASLLFNTQPARERTIEPARLLRIGADLADDVAYGAGVWQGCLTHRTMRPVLPIVIWRQRRPARSDSEGSTR